MNNSNTQKITTKEYQGDYPVADPPEYGDSDYKSRGGKIISGSPDLFMSLVRKVIDAADEDTIDNIDDLVQMMSHGRKIDPPTLYIDNNQVVDHDGRHRAEASRKLGYDNMPILIIDVNGKNVDGIDHLLKEDPSKHPRNTEFKSDHEKPELPLIDLDNPEKGRFSSVRQVIATVSRIEEENRLREETLSSDYKLLRKSEDAGISVSEMKSLLIDNFQNAAPEVKRLNEFLESEDATLLFAEEKKRSSNISFGPDLNY